MSDDVTPFRPGTSPFHVRGSTYLGMRGYAEANVHGGMAAVVERLPPDLRAFAGQVFLPVSLYDALPIRPITEVMADIEGLPYAESVRARARFVAKRDLNGLYKLVLKVASPEFVVERMPRLSLRYFDFGRVEIVSTTRGRCVVEQMGIPSPLAAWFMPMLEGYVSTVLISTGARSPRADFDAPRRDGERMGVETVTLRFTFLWG